LITGIKRLEDTDLILELKNLGSGIDFTTYTRSNAKDFVIKKRKIWGTRETQGTRNRYISQKHREFDDKYAVHKALGDNLPNYGVPTEPSEIIRLKKGERGILQRYINMEKGKGKGLAHINREANFINRNYGVDIDAHYGNIADGRLIDTGGNLKRSHMRRMDDAGRELLGIETWHGTQVKDIAGKSTIMSDEALLSGQSKKMLRKVNAMLKRGYRYKRTGPNEYKLVKKFTDKNRK
jgi:hypothetical protein